MMRMRTTLGQARVGQRVDACQWEVTHASHAFGMRMRQHDVLDAIGREIIALEPLSNDVSAIPC